MNKYYKNIIVLAAPLFLSACGGFGDDEFDTDLNDVSFSAGDLNVTKYVALGDSLTAGFADGALYKDGQINSFPNLLAQSFAEVDGGAFTQPLVNDNLGGLTSTIPALQSDLAASDTDLSRLVLAPDAQGSLGPVEQELVTTGVAPTTLVEVAAMGANFGNLGVPGAKSFHLTSSGYGDIAGVGSTANPFFVRFASAPTTSVLADAATQTPSFFTLWIGNNDVLGYATGGGVGADSSTTPAYGLSSGDITDPVAVFGPSYNGIVATLTAAGTNATQGLLINIPTITSIPFFTTVPFNAIPLDQATADATNASYDATYNAVLAASGVACVPALSADEIAQRTISFTAGQNAVVIVDEALTTTTCDTDGPGPNPAFALDKLRQATAEDFILLTTSIVLGKDRPAPEEPDDLVALVPGPVGIADPLQDSEVLTKDEAAEVEAARIAYNNIIQTAADANDNLAYFDVASLLDEVASDDGLNFGLGTVSSVFATGGAFSLDGVHPTQKGYAVVTNAVIDALNTSFNASLPKVNPADFPEVFFPFAEGHDFSQ